LFFFYFILFPHNGKTVFMNTERYACLKITQKNVWVLFRKPKLVAIAAKQKKIGTNQKDQMMQDNTPIKFYIKHFFINCQIKKLQPIFDTFVPPCIEWSQKNAPAYTECPQKKRRVHNSLIYRRILIIYTPN
jgi:hypothetical protein